MSDAIDNVWSRIVFDIETGPAPDDVIDSQMPEFEAPSNYKDPIKIEQALENKRSAFRERAALSPLTGEVLAIGAWIDGNYCSAIRGMRGIESEADVLAWFWGRVQPTTILIGFNSNRFDLPFLLKRSWACGVSSNLGGCRVNPSGRFDQRSCIDLMEFWQFGDRQNFISLDAVARFLGVGSKTGDGELFHKTLKAFPDEAEEYLRNDVLLTFLVAQRMGHVPLGHAFDADEVESAASPKTTVDDDY